MARKEISGLKRGIHTVLLLISAVTGLFLHSQTQAFNVGAIIALIIIAVYFIFADFALFGPTLFSLFLFLIGYLPIFSLGMIYIIPLAVYGIAILIIPSWRRHFSWFHWGKTDRITWLAALAIVILSSLSLYLWTVIFKPNLNDLLSVIPKVGFGTLLLIGLGFSVVNSVVEESIYRGVLWNALSRLFRRAFVINIIQAVIFGAAHIRGFPRGAIGVGLAVIYGLLLGAVRDRSKGLLAPYIVHFFADMTIFFILLWILGRI